MSEENDVEEVTACTHLIVRDSAGDIIIENENVIIQNIQTGNTFYLSAHTRDIVSVFGFGVREEIDKQLLYNSPDPGPSAGLVQQNNKWTRSATLALIELCGKYSGQFASTTIRNDKVYDTIMKDLKEQGFHYTASQCKDKYKYLKMRYLKKKDNMKRSGAAPFPFEFFDEMDQLLGKKANVEPIAVASSSRRIEDSDGETNPEDVLETSETETQPQVKKRRKSLTEAAIERRHQEKLAVQKAAITSFENIMAKLLEKF